MMNWKSAENCGDAARHIRLRARKELIAVNRNLYIIFMLNMEISAFYFYFIFKKITEMNLHLQKEITICNKL